MRTFSVKCPKCGIELEASEEYIGFEVACAECNYNFTLQKNKPFILKPVSNKYPNMLEDIKIGKLALAGFKLVFSKPKFDKQALDTLQTVHGSKTIFNFQWSILIKRTTNNSKRPLIDGYIRHWQTPVKIQNQEYFLCSQWFEYHRSRLIDWFYSFDVTYDELKEACQSSGKPQSCITKEDYLGKQNHHPAKNEISLATDIFFNFESPQKELAFTKPYLLVIDEVETKVKSWKDILRVICSILLQKYPHKFLALRGEVFSDFTKRVCLKSSNSDFMAPIEISNNLWVESNFNANTIVKLAVCLTKLCGFELNKIKVYYKRTKKKDQDNMSFPGQNKKNNVDFLSFHKTVDWSTFQSGITVPVSFHNTLKQHLSSKLLLGKSYPITIKIAGCEFQANILSPNFSDKSRKAVIQILWNKNSQIAKYMRTAYNEIFTALQLNKKNRDILIEKFEIRQAKEKDCFSFVLNRQRDNYYKDRVKKTDQSSVNTLIISLLETHFPNGIRPNSVIDINKLKNYFYEATNEEFAITDISLFLNSIGIRYGEKVYVVSKRGKDELKKILDSLISKDNRLFYYDEFYDFYADFFQEINIFSSKLLKMVLFDISPLLHYRKNYFAIESNVSIESEVFRVYETAICLSYEQLKTRLPYIPFSKIQQVLAQDQEFIWVNKGIYTHVKKIDIDKFEKNAAHAKVKDEIAEQGYASIISIDVSTSLELNPDLSENAIRKGLFQTCLASHYTRHGNIISPKGAVLNSIGILKDYCLKHEQLTLNELLEFEKEIYGRVHSLSLLAAYDTMVRIDKNTFICDNKINFDTETIDNALALFVNDDVIPLHDVTSFTSFPHIDGYLWNLYLLESYCRRFSKQFNYQCLSVNSKNVGAIFRESAKFVDYTAVLANAVAAAKIELNEKDVGDFLFNKGYIARRTGVIADIIAVTQILIKRKS